MEACADPKFAHDAGGLGLDPGTVDLWTARLPLEQGEMEICDAVLSADERLRGTARLRPADRAGFVAVRGLLRRLLALYSGVPAVSLCFHYGPKGKPALAGAPRPIRFNVSHAGDLALLAFARDAEVGVDVERLRAVQRMDRIAERVMPEDRLRDWRMLPPQAQATEFMREWTRLEAFSKLSGDGVWKTLLAGRRAAEQRATWFDIEPSPGYVGALAVGAPDMRLTERRWPGSET